ncbi:MAG: LysR family transcriptional regulator [Alphaproteobacteria bacterium]|nr:LysR family transcriptional regulator [Alphaproteobacteria bacterium]
MNIRQLECFREILITGTVTGAAKALGISQPSASSLIANLERELGFALFKRARGRLEATPEAQYLSTDVQQTLDSIELTAQRAKQIRDQRVGSLVVATYPDIAIDFLPKVISEFREGRPDLQITILARRSEMMRGLLPTHLYDLAVVESPSEHPSVEMEEFTFDCVCALPENHPLARRREITPSDLDGLPFISLLPEHDIYGQIERAFADYNASLNVVVETQTMESVSGFLRHGAGVGLLDPLTARRYAGQEIVIRPFAPSITQKIALVLPRDRLRSVVLEEFIKVLRSALGEVGR